MLNAKTRKIAVIIIVMSLLCTIYAFKIENAVLDKLKADDIKNYVSGIDNYNILQGAIDLDFLANVFFDNEIIDSVTVKTDDLDVDTAGDYTIIYTVSVNASSKIFKNKEKSVEIKKTVHVLNEQEAQKLSDENKTIYTSHMKVIKNSVEEAMEKKVFIIYDDENGTLSLLNKIIKEKIKCESYQLKEFDASMINEYDLILLGTSVVNDQISEQMLDFLNVTDFKNKDVSPYWVGTFDYENFEAEFQSHIHGAHILSGLGFNGDEISETEELSYIIDGWLTSVYTPV